MNILQFVPVKLTSFLVTGILLAYFWHPRIQIAIVISLCGILILYLLKNKITEGGGAWFGTLVMFVCIGAGLVTMGLKHHFTYDKLHIFSDNDDPRIWTITIVEELRSTEYYHRYIASVDMLENVRAEGLILCRMAREEGKGRLKVNDALQTWARADGIAPPRNPHQFDYSSFMRDQGIRHQILLNRSNHILLGQDQDGFMATARQNRNRLLEFLREQSFGKDELAVIEALLLGFRGDVSRELSKDYKAAGAMHIMAISGLHIGILLLLVRWLFYPLKFLPAGRHIQLLLSVLVLWCFAMLTGLSASVIRSVTMFSFIAYALYLNRPGSIFNIISLSAFFLLLIFNPLLLFQPGFQLSYAAVIAIIVIYPKLLQLWAPVNWLMLKSWQLFCVGLSAQLGVLPLSLYYFNQFPALFFISNMAVVPALGLILGTGFLILLLAILDWVPELLIWFYDRMIFTMNRLIRWVAGQDEFLIREIYFDRVYLVLSIALVILLSSLLMRISSKKMIALLCCIFLLLVWNGRNLMEGRRKNQLIVMHRTGVSALLAHSGTQMILYCNKPAELGRDISAYKTAEIITDIRHRSLENAYRLGNHQIMVLDDEHHFQTTASADVLLLSNSPRINLDRYLEGSAPQMVIADGSNYRSYVERWKKSCRRYSVPFHSTAASGAITLYPDEISGPRASVVLIPD